MRGSRSVGQFVRLFTRPNCGLCSNAHFEIEQAAVRTRFSYKEVDITKPENKEWHDKYAFDVPVVHVSASAEFEPATVFMHRVTEQEIVESVKTLSK